MFAADSKAALREVSKTSSPLACFATSLWFTNFLRIEMAPFPF
jgi:hypothetical protein